MATHSEEHEKLKFPKVMYIVTPTQLLQGFSQTLMLSVKAIFMTEGLGYSENMGVMLNHIFIALEPFSQLSGAVLADSKFGKWNIIIAGSLLLRIGDVFYILSVIPSFPQNAFFITAVLCSTIFGLHVPVLDAFLSEQFQMPEQEDQLKLYYNIYYWGRNVVSVAGSYAGSRMADIPCFGQQYCFAAPIILWVCVEVLFAIIILSLSSLYVKKPPSQSIFLHFLKCISSALQRRKKLKKVEKRNRWIDYADEKYNEEFRNDAFRLMAISYFFIIAIFYWALYDQMYSRFIYQTARLDGRVNDYIKLYPGDIIMINPGLVIVFLPILEYGVYPLCKKINVLTTDLQKIATSDYFIATSFLAACILEWMIEYYEFKPPGPGQCSVTIINGINEEVTLLSDLLETRTIEGFDIIQLSNLNFGKESEIPVVFKSKTTETKALIKLESGKGISFFLTRSDGLVALKGYDDYSRDPLGNSRVRALCHKKCFSLKLVDLTSYSADFVLESRSIYSSANAVPLMGKSYKILKNDDNTVLVPIAKLRDKYQYAIVSFEDKGVKETKVLTTFVNNQLTFFWIMPQIFLMTLGEIMHAIPWRLFLYTQSPPSMRSVVFALDLLARSLGDLLVAIIAGSSFLPHKYEFMFFSVLMYIVSGLFTYLALRYKPAESHE